MKFILVLLLGLSSLQTEASPLALRDRVATFLKKNVMGRTQTLSTEGTLDADGVSYLVKFQATISWDKLNETEEGLTFQETRDIKQTSTELDKAGKPVGQPINTDREVVREYALRPAADLLSGMTTISKNTLEDPTGTGFVTMAELSADDKELYLYESMAGFSEASLDGKNTIPVATSSAATLFLDKNGKLQTHETLKFYKVDVNKDFAREELHRFNLAASEK